MKLEEQQEVTVYLFANRPFQAWVRGIASIEYAVMGRMIIVEPDWMQKDIPPELVDYEFTCIVVPECAIKA